VAPVFPVFSPLARSAVTKGQQKTVFPTVFSFISMLYAYTSEEKLRRDDESFLPHFTEKLFLL
jgi:hypothetical protein